MRRDDLRLRRLPKYFRCNALIRRGLRRLRFPRGLISSNSAPAMEEFLSP
jgi:hypothetical protein